MSPPSLMQRFADEMACLFGDTETRRSSPVSPNIGSGANLIVSSDLPGLLIQGERKRGNEERREGYYPSERSEDGLSRVGQGRREWSVYRAVGVIGI